MFHLYFRLNLYLVLLFSIFLVVNSTEIPLDPNCAFFGCGKAGVCGHFAMDYLAGNSLGYNSSETCLQYYTPLGGFQLYASVSPKDPENLCSFDFVYYPFGPLMPEFNETQHFAATNETTIINSFVQFQQPLINWTYGGPGLVSGNFSELQFYGVIQTQLIWEKDSCNYDFRLQSTSVWADGIVASEASFYWSPPIWNGQSFFLPLPKVNGLSSSDTIGVNLRLIYKNLPFPFNVNFSASLLSPGCDTYVVPVLPPTWLTPGKSSVFVHVNFTVADLVRPECPQPFQTLYFVYLPPAGQYTSKLPSTVASIKLQYEFVFPLNPKTHNLSTGTIVGISLGCTAAVAILLVIGVFLWKKRNDPRREGYEQIN